MISKQNAFSTITLPNWYWETITKIVSNTDESVIKEKLGEVNTSYSYQEFRLIQNNMNNNFNPGEVR